jgi:hypothetical protein
MPQYYPHKLNGMQINIEPQEKSRWIAKRFHLEWWHLVGKRIFLTVSFARLDKSVPSPSGPYSIWIHYPNENPEKVFALPLLPHGQDSMSNKLETPLEISQSGNFLIDIESDFVRNAGTPVASVEKYPIYSAEIISGDIVFRDIVLVIIGSLLGGVAALIVGLILGFIQFSPALKLWIHR